MTRQLNYWKQQLGRVPDEVWAHSDAETLVLADNGLTELPPRIGELRNLRMLDLGHNALTSIPGTIHVTDFLYLHDNQLTSLPALDLPQIHYLNVSENRFTDFPTAICSMTGLIELRVTDNQLQSLPACIASLTRLRELHLRNNKLRTLPDVIGELRELRQIDLRGNPVETLPRTMLDLPRLEKVDLRWVDLTPAVEEVLAQLAAKDFVVYR